jgi:hypothetical protein
MSVQWSAFTHQLNEQINNDMIGVTVDHFPADVINSLILLKADC